MLALRAKVSLTRVYLSDKTSDFLTVCVCVCVCVSYIGGVSL